MKKDNSGRKALQAGVGYTIGNVLIRGISVISLPIFARLLSASDYGIYNTFTAYASIAFVIIGLAVHSSLKNAKIDYGNQINQYCSSMVLLVCINVVFVLIMSVLFQESLSKLLGLNQPIMVSLIIIDSFTLAMTTFYNSYLSLEYRSKEYIIVSLVYTLIGIIMSLYFILGPFEEQRYYGRIAGTVISGIIVTIYILYSVLKKAKPQINWEFWKYGLMISLPIIPHGLSQLVLSQFDRLMINKIIGSAEAGLYSFAYNIAAIFQIISTSVDTSWNQWFFDQMEKEEYEKIKKAASVYLAIMSLGVILLLLLSPEITLLLGGKKYSKSIPAAAPVILSMYYAYLYYFPSSIEYYMKKTKFIALGTICAAILNIVLNLCFIPKYGYIAAAYTTVICYFCYYCVHVYFSKKILSIRVFDIKQQFIWALGVGGIALLIAFMFEQWKLRLILIMIEIIVALLGVYRYKNYIKEIIKQILNKQ